MTYLFVLGNCPSLAKTEVETVLSQNKVAFNATVCFSNFFIIESADQIKPEVFDLLGGTVKVAIIFPSPIIDELARGKRPGERISFGLSGDTLEIRSKEIKQNLEELGYKVRFVLPPRGETELSSVVVKKQKLTEIYIVKANNQTRLARTIWVQDFADWGKRDYGRPAVQAYRGMLPPKVARMMVNIAGGETILDPFCGVGTILSEALLLGRKIIGSDIDSRQIDRSRKNLDWLAKEYLLDTGSTKLFVADAQTISFKQPAKSIDAVVTEPDLGPTDMDQKKYSLPAINDQLARLYSNCLHNWQKVLKTSGKVVMVIPSFTNSPQSPMAGADTHVLDSLIDKAKVMGYSFSAGPFEYFRPQAIVRRNICVFKL